MFHYTIITGTVYSVRTIYGVTARQEQLYDLMVVLVCSQDERVDVWGILILLFCAEKRVLLTLGLGLKRGDFKFKPISTPLCKCSAVFVVVVLKVRKAALIYE